MVLGSSSLGSFAKAKLYFVQLEFLALKVKIQRRVKKGSTVTGQSMVIAITAFIPDAASVDQNCLVTAHAAVAKAAQ